MTVIARRSLLMAAAPAVYASRAYAVDALPDARFVGFAQAVNDFGIRSGQLALAKSANENIRGYATRAVSANCRARSSSPRQLYCCVRARPHAPRSPSKAPGPAASRSCACALSSAQPRSKYSLRYAAALVESTLGGTARSTARARRDRPAPATP